MDKAAQQFFSEVSSDSEQGVISQLLSPEEQYKQKLSYYEECKKKNIIPFGKYKGKSLDILKTDEFYAEWVMKQKNEMIGYIKEYIKQNVELPKVDGSYIMRYGKYKGQLFSEIVKDKVYCFYVYQLVKPKGDTLLFQNYLRDVIMKKV